jgi:hypothetical protein
MKKEEWRVKNWGQRFRDHVPSHSAFFMLPSAFHVHDLKFAFRQLLKAYKKSSRLKSERREED